MSSTRKMSEPPSPPYNLPIGDTDTGTEAAEAVIEVAEAALGFTSVAAAAAGVAAAAAVEAAGAGAIDPARVCARACDLKLEWFRHNNLLSLQIHCKSIPSSMRPRALVRAASCRTSHLEV